MQYLLRGLLLMMCLSLPAQALDDGKMMALSISPIAPILGGLDLLYQIKVTDSLAITVPASIYYPWYLKSAVKFLADKGDNIKTTKTPLNWTTGLGAKFLVAGKGISDSFYIEPRVTIGYSQVGFEYLNEKLESSSYKVTPMLRGGWDFVSDSGFFMTFGLGAGVNIFFNNQTTIPSDIEDKFAIKYLLSPQSQKINFAWDGEFKIGYAW